MWSFSLALIVALIVHISAWKPGYSDYDEPRAPSEDSGSDYQTYENLVKIYSKKLELCGCDGSVLPTNPKLNHIKKCCGSVSYDNSTQNCCGNSTYDLNSDNDCCDEVFYSKKEAICCLSRMGKQILVKFSQEIIQNSATKNIACCGLQLYDNSTHACRAVRRNKLPPRPAMYHPGLTITDIHSSNSRSHREEMMLNYMTNQAFARYYYYLRREFINEVVKRDGSEFVSSSTKSILAHRLMMLETRFMGGIDVYGTCNNVSFNIFTHICCTMTKFTGNEITYEHGLHERKSSFSICCGVNSFDFTKEICCNDRSVHPQNDEISMLCCGDNAYDFTREECCESSNSSVAKKSLPDSQHSCCGDEKIAFLPSQKTCCGGKVMAKEDGKQCCGVEIIDSSESCCEGMKYNESTHICCGNGISLVKNSSNDNHCCGMLTYNIDSQICCANPGLSDSNIIKTSVLTLSTHDDSCCGLQLYNMTNQTCCDGKVINNNQLCCMSGNKEVIVKKTSNNDSCCGTKSFDQDTKLCCNENVVDLPANNFRCCGSKSYDPDSELCCDGNIVDAPTDYHRCCGSTIFDEGKQICCDGKVYDPKDRRQDECCGDKIMNNVKQICCRGAIKDVVNPRKSACCYSTLP